MWSVFADLVTYLTFFIKTLPQGALQLLWGWSGNSTNEHFPSLQDFTVQSSKLYRIEHFVHTANSVRLRFTLNHCRKAWRDRGNLGWICRRWLEGISEIKDNSSPFRKERIEIWQSGTRNFNWKRRKKDQNPVSSVFSWDLLFVDVIRGLVQDYFRLIIHSHDGNTTILEIGTLAFLKVWLVRRSGFMNARRMALGYFNVLVRQLPFSDLSLTAVCIEVNIRTVFGGLWSNTETNQTSICIYTLLHVYSASHAYPSALAQVVFLPAYFIAPLPYRIGKGFTDTCNCVLMWLSLYYFQHWKQQKEGEETSN